MLGFEPTEEEQLLKDNVDRFIERDYPFDRRRQAVGSDRGFRDETWAQFAELGWLGMTLPESAGGFGGGPRHTAVLMEAFGHGLVTEPYLSTVVMGANALALAGETQASTELLAHIATGDHLVSLAYAERDSRYDLNAVGTRAVPGDEGFILTGQKSVVLNGDSADSFVVSARTDGDVLDTNGISLFVVPTKQEGVLVRGYASNDGGRAAEVSFDQVSVGADALLGDAGAGHAVLEQVIDRATAAICAEALGNMTALNDMTLEYAKTRVQFDKPIGKNQALQHRLTDMFIALEESRSLLSVYMGDVESADPTERAKVVSAMKIQIGKTGRLIGQEAIQLHGGIAMTDEYVVSHYFKRLTVITRLFGDIDWHIDRFASLSH